MGDFRERKKGGGGEDTHTQRDTENLKKIGNFEIMFKSQ